MPTIQAKMTGTSYLTSPLYIGVGLSYTQGQGWSTYGYGLHLKNGSTVLKHFRLRTGSVAKGSYGNVSYDSSLGDSPTVTLYTSSYFSSANSTTRSVNLSLVAPNGCLAEGYEVSTQGSNSATNTSEKTLSTIKLTLDVPPTATVGVMTYDTNFVYAGLTTASVAVSNVSAKYGGTITDVTLTIGNQSDSISGDGTLSIALDTAGTFTPTVTVTDSRGQTKTYTLADITVQTYAPPSVTFTADRTDSAGTPADEGTYALCPATFTFDDVIGEAYAPSVVLTDENGTQTTPTVTWYTDDTLATTVTWSSLSSGDTVYGLIPGLNTNYSYQISIRPRDQVDGTVNTGTAIIQTVSSAFYTVDFLAGGHGIALGQAASQTGFYCNMAAHFADANGVMRALFDFVYPVGSYYETSDTSFDPNQSWGGTWVLETEGQVHISGSINGTYQVDGAPTDTTDGGEATHTLLTSEMPSHAHNPSVAGSGYMSYKLNAGVGRNRHATSSSGTLKYVFGSSTQDDLVYSSTSANKGGGDAHNNMQPYIIVHRWHRTA